MTGSIQYLSHTIIRTIRKTVARTEEILATIQRKVITTESGRQKGNFERRDKQKPIYVRDTYYFKGLLTN